MCYGVYIPPATSASGLVSSASSLNGIMTDLWINDVNKFTIGSDVTVDINGTRYIVTLTQRMCRSSILYWY